MEDNVQILLTEDQIVNKINNVAQKINQDRKTSSSTSPPIILGVLNGAFLFTSELVKKLDFYCYVDFCRISSYSGDGWMNRKEPKLIGPPKINPKGKDVYIIEDIVDTGNTIKFLINYLESQGVDNIFVVSLIKRKQDKRKIIDYYGVEINNEWVYGYGLDDNELKRNFKNIYSKK